VSNLNLSPDGILGEKTSVAAARVLREAILSGKLPPGDTLGEESLGRQLGLSRTPIREALVLLQSEGLIDTLPNRPAAVRSFTAEDLHEMYSLRAVLEGYAARMAASRLTDAQLSRLADSSARYSALATHKDAVPSLADENFTFHGIVVGAAKSDRLAGMIRQVTALPLIYQSYMSYSAESRSTADQDHKQILAALLERDPDRAEVAMKAHVLWARDVALAHFPLVADEQKEAAAARS
jgi:DNA-binding GntR family transcriptional regulator